jgi:hypothetical protein
MAQGPLITSPEKTKVHEIYQLLGIKPGHFLHTAYACWQAGYPKRVNSALERAQCAAAQDLLNQLGKPIGEKKLLAWLSPIWLGTKVGAMRDDAEGAGRMNAIAIAFVGKPQFLFTAGTQALVLQNCEYMPTAAEIWRVIGRLETQFQSLQYGLNSVVVVPLPVAATTVPHITSDEFRAVLKALDPIEPSLN